MVGWAKKLGGIALFLAMWEAVARSGSIPTEYFPTVPTIASAIVGFAASPDFIGQVSLTWGRTLSGLALAIALGLGVAIVTARYAIVRPALEPISIFAIGLGAKLFLFIIAFAAVWPIYVNAANALSVAEPVQMLTGRSFGYSNWEILFRLRLPAALPEIVTGVRLAAGIALLAAVAAEMLAGESGLGYLLYDAAFTLRTTDMFAIMFVVGISGVLLNLLVANASRIFIGWHLGFAATGDVRLGGSR